jgi:hypothetical protein
MSEKTAVICQPCTAGDHPDCQRARGNWACVCDNSVHPDAGRRAAHNFTHDTPDYGSTVQPEEAPVLVEEGVKLKPDEPTPVEVVKT